MTDWILSESSYSHEIDVPIDQVDIADWLAHLRNAEFQRCCPPDHIACGFTHTDEGQPMSINVETIGKSLLMQQYVAEVFESHLCRMVSVSDVFPFSGGRTHTVVTWTLAVEPISIGGCRFVKSVTANATEAFLDFITQHGQTLADAATARQQAFSDHNRRETPRYAASIASAARARQTAAGLI
jgi:hypothetical protein